MPIVIDQEDNPNEESSINFNINLYDYAGLAIGEATSITWSLRDEDGDVVNSRLDVDAGTSGSFWIHLEGDDLAISSSSGTVRKLTIKFEYVSARSATDKGTEEITFVINDLVGVT